DDQADLGRRALRPVGAIDVGLDKAQRARSRAFDARNVIERPHRTSGFAGRTRTILDLHDRVRAAHFGEIGRDQLLIHLDDLVRAQVHFTLGSLEAEALRPYAVLAGGHRWEIVIAGFIRIHVGRDVGPVALGRHSDAAELLAGG